jgi:hypothetical protein
MTYGQAKSIAELYRRQLREIRRKKLEIATAPPEVQQASLALLQIAQLVWKFEHYQGRIIEDRLELENEEIFK